MWFQDGFVRAALLVVALPFTAAHAQPASFMQPIAGP